jgi:hypothetical protein
MKDERWENDVRLVIGSFQLGKPVRRCAHNTLRLRNIALALCVTGLVRL